MFVDHIVCLFQSSSKLWTDHCQFMDLMGLDKDGVIIVHMGVRIKIVHLNPHCLRGLGNLRR